MAKRSKAGPKTPAKSAAAKTAPGADAAPGSMEMSGAAAAPSSDAASVDGSSSSTSSPGSSSSSPRATTSSATIVESEPLRVPFRRPPGESHQKHIEVVLDRRQAFILRGVVEAVVPQDGETVRRLANGRVIGAGPSNTADVLRWLIEQIDAALPAALTK